MGENDHGEESVSQDILGKKRVVGKLLGYVPTKNFETYLVASDITCKNK